MPLEDGDVLNGTSRSRRLVDMLNVLNESVSNLTKLSVLHLDQFLETGLPLRDVNPKYVEDHAAVCEGIHEFAVTSQRISNQFQFYSQVAFAHILKYGYVVPPAEKPNTSNSTSSLSNDVS